MEPDTLALVRFCIDMACVAAFALSGVLAARDRKAELDLFGVVVVAVVTAIGGGTLRDVLLDVPVFWLEDTSFIYCPILAGLCLAAAVRVRCRRLLRRDSGLRRPCPLCRIRLYRRLRTARQKSGCHHRKDELPRSVHSSILPHLPQPDRAAGSVCPDCITPSGGRQFPLCGPPRPLFC